MYFSIKLLTISSSCSAWKAECKKYIFVTFSQGFGKWDNSYAFIKKLLIEY